MHVVFAIFPLLIWLGFVSCATRVYFIKCDYNGFKCTTVGTKVVGVAYECPKNVSDVLILINQFSAPTTIETLEIKNCNTITISTRCTGESKRIQKLLVTNIGHLTFQRLQYDPMLPPTVIFQNISFIQEIPFKTFAQIEKQFYSLGCSVQPVDFKSIHFENVTIDTIQSESFVGLNQFGNFSFVNVNIKTVQTSGIRVKLNHNSLFRIFNSTITIIEPLGIQVYARRSIFSENQLIDVHPNAINGTMEDFYFTDNFIETLHPYGFSLLATNVFILRNNFLQLKSSALEKISPGLIQDSKTNFGKLKFVYDFSKNVLNFVDAAGLHPDYTSYENVNTEMMFSRNTFLCSCQNLGWLFSTLGQGPNTPQLESFYEMVLDESYDNICDRPFTEPCTFPIKKLRTVMKAGSCLTGDNVEDLCRENKSVEVTTERVWVTSEGPKEGPISNLIVERMTDEDDDSNGSRGYTTNSSNRYDILKCSSIAILAILILNLVQLI